MCSKNLYTIVVLSVVLLLSPIQLLASPNTTVELAHAECPDIVAIQDGITVDLIEFGLQSVIVDLGANPSITILGPNTDSTVSLESGEQSIFQAIQTLKISEGTITPVEQLEIVIEPHNSLYRVIIIKRRAATNPQEEAVISHLSYGDPSSFYYCNAAPANYPQGLYRDGGVRGNIITVHNLDALNGLALSAQESASDVEMLTEQLTDANAQIEAATALSDSCEARLETSEASYSEAQRQNLLLEEENGRARGAVSKVLSDLKDERALKEAYKGKLTKGVQTMLAAYRKLAAGNIRAAAKRIARHFKKELDTNLNTKGKKKK